MNKKKRTIIDNLIRKEANNASTSFLLKQKSLAEDFSNRGLLSSGSYVSALMKEVTEQLTSSCKRTLEEIVNYQNLWNRKHRHKDIESYSIHMNTIYVSLVDSLYSNIIIIGLSSTIEITKNSLKQNINNLIKKTFEEIEINNKLARQPASVRQVWWSIVISILSLLVAILALFKK